MATEGRVTQHAIELLSQPVGVTAVVSQVAYEVLSQSGGTSAVVSQLVCELLASVAGTGTLPPGPTASPYGLENIAVGVPGPNPEIP